MDTTFTLLAALALAPAHPYALLDHLRGAGIPVSRSALYRAADALVAQGLAEASVEGEGGGRLRRRLALTPLGRARLAAEALAALDREPVDSPEFGLALAAARAAGSEEPEEVLRRRLAAAARRLTAVEAGLRERRPGPFPATVREHEAARLRAEIGWLQGELRRAG